jgi:hypothetical protein
LLSDSSEEDDKQDEAEGEDQEFGGFEKANNKQFKKRARRARYINNQESKKKLSFVPFSRQFTAFLQFPLYNCESIYKIS